MTVEEIFNKLVTHMNEGIKTHCEMARAYEFLELEGFAQMHDYHTIEEKCGCLRLCNYYTRHYHKLLKPEIIDIKIIPDTWYKYQSKDVDNGTKKNAIKELMEKWVSWEQETKTLYQNMRRELDNIGEVAAALELDKYVLDVTDELKHAEQKLIHLETISYDLVEVTSWQRPMKNKYKKKLGW